MDEMRVSVLSFLFFLIIQMVVETRSMAAKKIAPKSKKIKSKANATVACTCKCCDCCVKKCNCTKKMGEDELEELKILGDATMNAASKLMSRLMELDN